MSAGRTLEQMLVIMLLILVGVVCQKIGIINADRNKCLSQLVSKVFNPAIIFSSMITNTTGGRQEFILGTFGVAAILYLFCIVIGTLFSKLFDKRKLQQHIYQLMFVFPNQGFIGIPLVRALFGAEYIIYVGIFVFEYNVIIYTYGLSLLKENGEKFHLRDLKQLINMGTIACAAALFVFATGIHLPSPVESAISYLGDAAIPLSLIVIGTTVAEQKNIAAMLKDKQMYLFIVLKMIVLPLMCIPILKAISMPSDIRQICFIMEAMPVGTMPLVLLTERDLDTRVCTNAIVLTTILSVLTIPLMVFIYNMF